MAVGELKERLLGRGGGIRSTECRSIYGCGRLSVAGVDGGRSCRASDSATPLADKVGHILLNWDESRPGRGGHVTTGACRWMITAARGQRINLTLYHFGAARQSSSSHYR